jgi:hypothetical protein
MIVGVPAVLVPLTDPDDPRLANFRDLTAGDRRLGTDAVCSAAAVLGTGPAPSGASTSGW